MSIMVVSPENLELKRVRVLVIGGGIHGCGVLHDLASRGWHDIHLVEKNTIASATSSSSTKLIHGGLRYLQNISDFNLVFEALNERALLLDLLPELVKPLEIMFPILKSGGINGWLLKAGLTLYDILAYKHNIKSHDLLSRLEMLTHEQFLELKLIKKMYSYWDAQTNDRLLTKKIAASALELGATIEEHAEVLNIEPFKDGFKVKVKSKNGEITTISALYVVNVAGPWTNALLEKSNITPTHSAFNNKGSHLLFDDIGLKCGYFLQSPKDNRLFFVLPWNNKTLIGTTEEVYSASPDVLKVEEKEVSYLLDSANTFLKDKLDAKDIKSTFTGLRWLATGDRGSITSTSRSHSLGEIQGERGFIISLYGGKLTTYRRLAQEIGDRINTHFTEFTPSNTHLSKYWVK